MLHFMSFNNYSLSTHWIWNHMKSGLYLTIANGKYFVSNFTEYWTFGYLNLFFNFATLGAMHFYIRWLSIWAGNRSCVDQWEHQECNIQSWKFKKFTLVQFSFFFFFFFFFWLKLSQVPVVGVNCAACVFPCLDKLKFPVKLIVHWF